MRNKKFFFGLRKSSRIYLSLLLSAFLMLLFTSCQKNDDNFFEERRVQGRISFLDVVDARALILGGDEGNLKSEGLTTGTPENSIFKITEDGVVQEITYWQIDTIYIETEDGMETKIDSVELTNTLYPVHIFNADDNHLIVCFDQVAEEATNGYFELEYLVRKSDGAVFELPLGYRPITRWSHFNQMFKNEESSVLIQTDEAGYIYFVGKNDIIKLSTQNPENITFQQITTTEVSGEGVTNYRVNGAGHIIFNSEGISNPRVTKLRFSSGGLAYPNKNIIPFWLGFDNSFYYSYTPDYQPGVPSMPVVEKLTIENGQINYEKIGEVNHPDADLTYMGIGSFIFRMEAINKIVVMDFVDNMDQIGDVVAEVYNNENQVKVFSMEELGITSINIGLCSDNYYYLAGLNGNQPVLLKVNPSVFPHSVEQLVPEGSYDIYKMAVTSDDYVMIHALRMSDGNHVISQISPTGVITQMEDIGTEVIQLVQIR
jgi:hypothetical protein